MLGEIGSEREECLSGVWEPYYLYSCKFVDVVMVVMSASRIGIAWRMSSSLARKFKTHPLALCCRSVETTRPGIFFPWYTACK